MSDIEELCMVCEKQNLKTKTKRCPEFERLRKERNGNGYLIDATEMFARVYGDHKDNWCKEFRHK